MGDWQSRSSIHDCPMRYDARASLLAADVKTGVHDSLPSVLMTIKTKSLCKQGLLFNVDKIPFLSLIPFFQMGRSLVNHLLLNPYM